MAIETPDDLFINELKDIYSAEKQAVKIYPRLSKAVSSPELQEALQVHLDETKGQLERLERIFEVLEVRAGGKTCEGMKGLIEEGSEMLEEIEEGSVRDAALIGAAQRMEHYEIAAYGTVLAFAKATEQEEIAQLLAETLEEEKTTDEKLTGVAELVNQQALSEVNGAGDEDVEEEEEEDPAPKQKKKSSKK